MCCRYAIPYQLFVDSFFFFRFPYFLNRVNNNQQDALFSLFYRVNTLLHDSGVLTAHHQVVEYIRGVSKTFGEWYQQTNKTEDTNKLTLLAFKIIAILHNTLLTTFIKFLETVGKGLFRNRSQNS
jgi:hypothetical protein